VSPPVINLTGERASGELQGAQKLASEQPVCDNAHHPDGWFLGSEGVSSSK
jgi:hypothetical protein